MRKRWGPRTQISAAVSRGANKIVVPEIIYTSIIASIGNHRIIISGIPKI